MQSWTNHSNHKSQLNYTEANWHRRKQRQNKIKNNDWETRAKLQAIT